MLAEILGTGGNFVLQKSIIYISPAVGIVALSNPNTLSKLHGTSRLQTPGSSVLTARTWVPRMDGVPTPRGWLQGKVEGEYRNRNIYIYIYIYIYTSWTYSSAVVVLMRM